MDSSQAATGRLCLGGVNMTKRVVLLPLVITCAVLLGTSRAHEHKAPHKGTLIEFSPPAEFAHLELVLDKTSGKITGYVLDREAEKAVRIFQKEIEIKVDPLSKAGIAAAFTVTLKAQSSALTGEKEGDTSEFEGQSDKLKGLTVFDAAVSSIKVKGKEFTSVKFNFPKGNE